MSMNEHAEQATKRLRNGTINEVKRASVEASLALAYEQRTANLIAYEAGLAQAFRDNAINENGVRLWKLAADEVHERLGLA